MKSRVSREDSQRPMRHARFDPRWGRNATIRMVAGNVLMTMKALQSAHAQVKVDQQATFFMGRVRYSAKDGNDCGTIGRDLIKLDFKTLNLKLHEGRMERLTGAELASLRMGFDHGGFCLASGCCTNLDFPKARHREVGRPFPGDAVKSMPHDPWSCRDFHQLDWVRVLNKNKGIHREEGRTWPLYITVYALTC